MAKSFEDRPTLRVFSASRQLGFHQLLVAARKTWMREALAEALKTADPEIVKRQLSKYAPREAQRVLATAGVRDEHVFPVPIILEAKPTLIGYYRLLLGIPQKSFYGSGTGMGQFKSMEVRGLLRRARRPDIEGFCIAMGKALGELVCQMTPAFTPQDAVELPLLTLGSQFQGGKNNTIGKQATIDVFLAVSDLVKDHVVHAEARRIEIRNAAGRKVVIALAADPDIRVQEEFDGSLRNIVAIEIKGGADISNAHNRAGEAEKSHQKAKRQGFRDYWTLISKAGLDIDDLKAESQTTNDWFDVAQVLAREGPDWDLFRSRWAGATGIPTREE